ILPVFGFSFTLPVRSIRTAMDGAFIRLQPCPFQTVENIFLRSGYIAALVGILNTQYKISLVLLCKQIVIQNSSYTTQVQSPGRTRCKSYPYFFCCWHKRKSKADKSILQEYNYLSLLLS